eukprot:jgi/Mesvir1/25741/Mv01923-RA.1
MLCPNAQVAAAVREHFGCHVVDGAELEQQGGFEPANSHWQSRIFYGELMGRKGTNFPVVSKLTLALFEDSGWYVPNYDQAGALAFGFGAGCDFALKSCANAYSMPNVFEGVYCRGREITRHFKGRQYTLQSSCTYDGMAVGGCVDCEASGRPPHAQKACEIDGCTPLKSYSNYHCTMTNQGLGQDPGHHSSPEFWGQSFSPSARCFGTGLEPWVKDKWIHPPLGSGCFERRCFRNGTQWTLQVQVGKDHWVTCVDGELVDVTGGGVHFRRAFLGPCPVAREYCPDNSCPLDCSNRGICRNLVCHCIPGYTGPHCEKELFTVAGEPEWQQEVPPFSGRPQQQAADTHTAGARNVEPWSATWPHGRIASVPEPEVPARLILDTPDPGGDKVTGALRGSAGNAALAEAGAARASGAKDGGADRASSLARAASAIGQGTTGQGTGHAGGVGMSGPASSAGGHMDAPYAVSASNHYAGDGGAVHHGTGGGDEGSSQSPFTVEVEVHVGAGSHGAEGWDSSHGSSDGSGGSRSIVREDAGAGFVTGNGHEGADAGGYPAPGVGGHGGGLAGSEGDQITGVWDDTSNQVPVPTPISAAQLIADAIKHAILGTPLHAYGTSHPSPHPPSGQAHAAPHATATGQHTSAGGQHPPPQVSQYGTSGQHVSSPTPVVDDGVQVGEVQGGEVERGGFQEGGDQGGGPDRDTVRQQRLAEQVARAAERAERERLRQLAGAARSAVAAGNGKSDVGVTTTTAKKTVATGRALSSPSSFAAAAAAAAGAGSREGMTTSHALHASSEGAGASSTPRAVGSLRAPSTSERSPSLPPSATPRGPRSERPKAESAPGGGRARPESAVGLTTTPSSGVTRGGAASTWGGASEGLDRLSPSHALDGLVHSHGLDSLVDSVFHAIGRPARERSSPVRSPVPPTRASPPVRTTRERAPLASSSRGGGGQSAPPPRRADRPAAAPRLRPAPAPMRDRGMDNREGGQRGRPAPARGLPNDARSRRSASDARRENPRVLSRAESGAVGAMSTGGASGGAAGGGGGYGAPWVGPQQYMWQQQPQQTLAQVATPLVNPLVGPVGYPLQVFNKAVRKAIGALDEVEWQLIT